MAGTGGYRWTGEELRTARPDVLDAARWLVYVDRIWPGADFEAQVNAPDREPTEGQRKHEKFKARQTLRALRKQLLPEDDD